MSRNAVVARERFEAWVAAPPYERSVSRFSDNPAEHAWPGQYQDLAVQLAWEAFQAALTGGVEHMEPQTAVDLAAEWNAAHPVGTHVRYWRGARDGAASLGVTRCEAFAVPVWSGPFVAVFITGCRGYVALSHVEVLKTPEWLVGVQPAPALPTICPVCDARYPAGVSRCEVCEDEMGAM